MRRILALLFISVTLKVFAQPCSPPTVVITQSARTCACSQIVVSSNVISSNAPFTFKWMPGGDTLDAIVVSPCVTTTYTLTVTNACGDSTKKTVTVTPYFATPTAVCCDTSIIMGDSARLYVSGSKPSAKYRWTPTTGLNCDTCDTLQASPTTTTTYTVTETDSMGCMADTTVVVRVGPAAIFQVHTSSFVNVYPNPSSTEFTVDLPAKAQINVCDITGRLLFSQLENAGTFTFGSTLNKGIYLLYIDGKQQGKIVKM